VKNLFVCICLKNELMRTSNIKHPICAISKIAEIPFGNLLRFIFYTPARIKGPAIFRSRPSTNNNFLSPVQFFPGIFPMSSLKKHQKLSPVHSRPSCPASKLVARPVFRPSFYTGGGVVEKGFLKQK